VSRASKLRVRLVWAALGLSFYPGCYLDKSRQYVDCRPVTAEEICPTGEEDILKFFAEKTTTNSPNCDGTRIESVDDGPFREQVPPEQMYLPPGPPTLACCYVVTDSKQVDWFPGECGRTLRVAGRQRVAAVAPGSGWG